MNETAPYKATLPHQYNNYYGTSLWGELKQLLNDEK